MTKKINLVLDEVYEKINPDGVQMSFIKKSLNDFLDKLKSEIDKKKIKVEVFVGGSFAKGSLVKKDKYDIDIYLRYDLGYSSNDLDRLTKKILKKFKYKVVHGSRDYFQVLIDESLYFEIVPVRKINNPKESNNITDLSYSHVRYVNKNIKSKDLLRDIKLAKIFCSACGCYGAESYINGFSGYSLELLIYYYKGFAKFIKDVVKIKEKKVIDIEKLYKNKNEILMDMNSAKLGSPIVLVDPTYKYRNVLAALSDETLKKFQKHCKDFLKNPSAKYFEKRKIDLEKIRQDSKKKKYEFVLLDVKTDKQEGDIAGSKLLKFYKHLIIELQKYFEIKDKGFSYDKKNMSKCFFVVKCKKEVLLFGPDIDDKKNILKFRKKHKNVFVRNKRLYVKQKIDFNINSFLKVWIKKNKKLIKDMYVSEIRIG